MKVKILSLIILSSLLLGVFGVSMVQAAKPKVVVFAKGEVEPDVQLKAMMSEIQWIEWVAVLSELKPENLTGASMLIMVKIDATNNYTTSEINAVKSWFAEGGKTLWVTSDSDFPPSDVQRQPSANQVLSTINSKLRIEHASAEDPGSMADAPYRVLGLSEACDPKVGFLVKGVTRGLFHGPGIVVGYSNGKYVSLEKERVEGVYRIMTTSEKGEVKDNSPPLPEVHKVGDVGRLTLMAIEIDSTKKNVIIATGEAPISQYDGLYRPELRNQARYGVKYPTQGDILFNNLLGFCLVYKETWITDQKTITDNGSTISSLTTDKTTLTNQVNTLTANLSTANSSINTWQMTGIGLLVVGLAVGVIVGPMLFKKK